MMEGRVRRAPLQNHEAIDKSVIPFESLSVKCLHAVVPKLHSKPCFCSICSELACVLLCRHKQLPRERWRCWTPPTAQRAPLRHSS